jgi:hypothetical protein
VTSFFEGRLRFLEGFALAFSILERNTDDLIARLSRFVAVNVDADVVG